MNNQGTEFRDDRRAGSYLPAATVRELNQLSAWKATLSVLETVGVIALAIGISLYWWTPWVVVPAIFIIATRQQACFVLAHDAAHYRLYPQRWLNDLVGRSLAMMVGISMSTYRVIHRLHHNHLYEARDPDMPIHGGYPRGRTYLWRKIAKDLSGLTAYKTYSYFFGAPVINDDAEAAGRPLDDTSPALRRAARQDRWLVAGFHVAAPIAAFAAGYGVEYLLLWLLPMVTLLQAILRVRAICEHGAVDDIASPLKAARTNLGPKALLWLFFPHHVHYHIEHHLYPAVPHYNLKACHDALRANGALGEAEVRRLPDTVRRVFADPATAL